MNKHIELVKKWLADKDSVSLEELEANKKAADAAYGACDAAYDDADVSAYTNADVAEYWVNRYEELTE
jgi:hypothetical protein